MGSSTVSHGSKSNLADFEVLMFNHSGGQTPGGCSADPTGEIYRNAVGQITAFINSGNNKKNGDVIDPQVTAC